jgi:hypothetical protein
MGCLDLTIWQLVNKAISQEDAMMKVQKEKR